MGAGKVGCFFKCISGGRRRDSHPWGGGQGSHSRKLFLSVPWAYFTERSPRLPGRGIWSRELCPAVQVPLRPGCISGLQRADSGPSCPGCKPTCGQLGGQLWDLPEPLWQKGANLPSREVVRIDIVHIHFFIRSLSE